MLNKEPRAATVICATETATLLSLDSHSFSLLLGDAFAALIRNSSDNYLGGAGDAPETHTHSKPVSILTQTQLIDRMLEEQGLNNQEAPNVLRSNLQCIGALGYGAFGVVTLEKDLRTNKLYAMKALSKGYIKCENLKDHVLNEKKTMQMLSSLFCVHLHQTYRDAQYVYFLLDPVLGGELYDIYCKYTHFFGAGDHAKFYAVCASLGLQHLHDRKIIYRDLKLENVLLTSEGYALITDMGLAKVVIGKTYTVCGTADYFAPETLRQAGHNRAVDWWALGVMIFVMMAGRSPFDAENVMQIYRNIVKGFKKEHFPETFAADLVDLIKSLCNKKPECRLPMASGGAANLETHSWFQSLPFATIERRARRAPFVPPLPNYEAMADKLRAGHPPEVEFVHNDELTDHGWDDEFDRGISGCRRSVSSVDGLSA